MAVIFEGDDLVVHEIEGDSQYAVVTFGAADQCHRATDEFFAERPLRIGNIRSIGITTKKVLWFISPEVEQVISLVNDRLSDVENRIIFGYSMGAYPALKWSRRLNAKTVFSMAPKYSLDPDLCDLDPDYIDRYFKDELRGMFIGSEDVGGRIFIVHDPDHRHDTYHVGLIAEKLTAHDVTLIPSFYSEHFIPRAFTGRHKFLRLMDALANGTRETVCHTFAKERRTSLNNVEALFTRTIHHRPDWSFRALLAPTIFVHDNLKPLFEKALDIGRLAHRLSERGSFGRSAICRNLPLIYARYGRNIERSQVLAAGIKRLVPAPLGFHGHILCYDITNHTFIGGDLVGSAPLHRPVILKRFGGHLFFQITIGEETLYLYEHEGDIMLSDEARPSGFHLVKSARNAHHHIRSRLGNLCSHPNGTYELNSKNNLEWEEFSIPSEFPT
ncbi:hypothetical protein [Asaia bogorensis]|uniref:Alpha/beta hydrolase n=1 Tax=Asaia bogorensis NBRC 16594 TaxID=1231624 RepID=A0AAN4U1Z6_9PROT|nr:hypothetical protein [Asaia bogorensis]BAT18580.1 hypothetical protein Asbog_00268 [Asaia bogorensis NBRC 16594]GBQ75192.1 hypothetical protein AA0311_0787 [Asaia bogorensis NBRC 16594]GEL52932.1 hypothetical protein ABO01nite_09390 [Asaia bogorensis NBRC 16594]